MFDRLRSHGTSAGRIFARSHIEGPMAFLPANANSGQAIVPVWSRNPKILSWLTRLTQPGLSFNTLSQSFDRADKISVEQQGDALLFDDWQTVAALCGHGAADFIEAGAALPLTAAEVDHFRRNHRGTENHVSRDFLAARTDLPSPLAELYGLYLHRARVDAEATLFVAQATGSTRVARVMADLLAIGSFANGTEYIGHIGVTYSVPAAFDTSDIIDRANHEAARRLSMDGTHPSHLLKLSPDEIGVLASNIVEQNALSGTDFLAKANKLAEARQDVNRLPVSQHFTTAIIERDLPMNAAWVTRLCAAYARILDAWVADLPEAKTALN